MRVYTYCSFEASAKGYQYAEVYRKKPDNSSRKRSLLNTDERNEIKKWMENQSGWKLVLKRKGRHSEEAYLFLAALESVIRDINMKRIGDSEDVEGGNRHSSKEKKVVLKLEKVQLYANIAMSGKLNELYPIAIGCLLEFHKDAGKDIYKKLKESIRSEEGKESYIVDGVAFFSILSLLSRKGKSFIGKNMNKGDKKIGILKKLYNNRINPYFRITQPYVGKSIDSIIKELPRPQEFSLNNMIYIAEDDALEKYGVFNVAMDYNFVKKGARL